MDAISAHDFPAGSPPGSNEIRLTLRLPVAGERSIVDGAWWPWSTDLAAELPGLVDALHRRGLAVWRIAYSLAAWDPDPPRRIAVGGRTVRTGGFRVIDPQLVSLSRTAGGASLDLLVVPPGTEHDTAVHALMAAATVDQLRAETARFAAATTAVPAALAAEAAERGREDDWDSEGGHLAASRG